MKRKGVEGCLAILLEERGTLAKLNEGKIEEREKTKREGRGTKWGEGRGNGLRKRIKEEKIKKTRGREEEERRQDFKTNDEKN